MAVKLTEDEEAEFVDKTGTCGGSTVECGGDSSVVSNGDVTLP